MYACSFGCLRLELKSENVQTRKITEYLNTPELIVFRQLADKT